MVTELFVLTFDSTLDWRAIRPWEMHVLYNPDGIVKYSVIHRLRLINYAQLAIRNSSQYVDHVMPLFITYYGILKHGSVFALKQLVARILSNKYIWLLLKCTTTDELGTHYDPRRKNVSTKVCPDGAVKTNNYVV